MPYNHSIKAASPSGTAYTGRADGIFSLNEQVRFKSSGLWATAVSIPGAPTSVTAVGGNAQAIVSFTAPASNGGSAITSYTVTSSSGQTATGSSSPITITGLSNGSSYTFTVTATSVLGTSASSGTSTSITLVPPVNIIITSGSTYTPSYTGSFPILCIGAGGGGSPGEYYGTAGGGGGGGSGGVYSFVAGSPISITIGQGGGLGQAGGNTSLAGSFVAYGGNGTTSTGSGAGGGGGVGRYRE
jgi:hypothetical protein